MELGSPRNVLATAAGASGDAAASHGLDPVVLMFIAVMLLVASSAANSSSKSGQPAVWANSSGAFDR